MKKENDGPSQENTPRIFFGGEKNPVIFGVTLVQSSKTPQK